MNDVPTSAGVAAPTTCGGRILLVEDSPTQAMRLCHLLEAAGFVVTLVTRAEAALDELNHALPDLLVTDFHLPGMLGDELCRRIRMNVNTRGIPLLMLTNNEGALAEQQGLASGADDYIWKSASDDILLIRIQALLRKSQAHADIGLAATPFTAIRLLLVEDSPTYQEFISRALSGEGYEVKTVGTAQAALEWLGLADVDAVVLDMNLPDMSGVELCRRFVATRRTADRAFVLLILSAEENPAALNAMLAAGADDVIAKSRDIDIVMARLRALVRRKLLYEENRRIIGEFQARELAVLRAEAERRAAESRAAFAGQLAQANHELEIANRELKEAQAQLVQSAKMASLGQLVAGVAHEINNPLAFVLSYQRTAWQNLCELRPELDVALAPAGRARLAKLERRLADMRIGLDRIEDLVVKLRTFSRLDEGEFKQVDIIEGIESVLTLLNHRLAERIVVERRFSAERLLDCYPGPLNQVFMNIIANAIDALGEAGTITITTGTEDGTYLISVADTGAGIPAAIRDRIFDPFFTTKGVAQGTGLGLSISYGIVKKHGGEIELESEEGRGTKITIRIPRQAARMGPGE